MRKKYKIRRHWRWVSRDPETPYCGMVRVWSDHKRPVLRPFHSTFSGEPTMMYGPGSEYGHSFTIDCHNFKNLFGFLPAPGERFRFDIRGKEL